MATGWLTVAKALKGFLDNLRVDRFFDEVSIQPGDTLTEELRAEIKDAALVAIRTDGYVSSPWCRQELALAKAAQRPMVVVDALSGQEPRSSPLLVNLPSVRLAVTDLKPKKKAEKRLEEVINFVGLEAVLFLHSPLRGGSPAYSPSVTRARRVFITFGAGSGHLLMCRGAQLQAGEMLQEIGFALDSLLEERRFELSVPP
jgi:hypothetical protein